MLPSVLASPCKCPSNTSWHPWDQRLRIWAVGDQRGVGVGVKAGFAGKVWVSYSRERDPINQIQAFHICSGSGCKGRAGVLGYLEIEA